MMRIALMQQPFLVANIHHNLAQIVAFYAAAKKEKAELALTPFMSLTGFPLFDLKWHDFLYQEVEAALTELLALRGPALLLTYPAREKGRSFICQALIQDGAFLWREEIDYSGLEVDSHDPVFFRFKDVTFALMNGKSLSRGHWASAEQKADAVILTETEPFYDAIRDEETENLLRITSKTRLPVLALNMLGANDEYLFAGGSFALTGAGKESFQARYFTPGNYVLTLTRGLGFKGEVNPIFTSRAELFYEAITFSMRQYFLKTGFTKVCLGLSGGIDSALVLALAVQVVGAENCEVFLLPSQYTRGISNDYAARMAKNLGVKYSLVPISPIFQEFLRTLAPRFAGLPPDKTEENIQARIRGTLLMALSNKTGAILLATGNKSEGATGYGTLYGDTNGGFAPIKDLLKTEVYAVSNWINKKAGAPTILPEIIARAPSAELKEEQTDQDTLPEYPLLDEIIKLILANESFDAIVALGFPEKTVEKVMDMLRRSEFKRQQGVFGPKLTRRSFGHEWHYPITRVPDHF